MNKSFGIPLYYYPLWLLLRGLALLPLPVLYLLSDVLYVLVYYIIGYRKKVVAHNLRSAFPEKGEEQIQQIMKDFYKQFMDVVVETLKLSAMSKAEMKRRVTFTNQELLDGFVRKGTPVIIMGSHAGNWEWILPAGAVQFSFPTDGIYKPLNNPFFEKFMLHTRSHLGTRLIKMKETLRDFVKNKDVPRVIAMLSDQTPMRSEIQFWTTFLHQDTPFYVGAEKLANNFGYPVLFLDVYRIKRGHYRLTFEELSDGAKNTDLAPDAYPITEAFARRLEAAIQRSPADYLWTHRRWKHRRDLKS